MEKDKLEKKYYTVSEIAKTVGITRNKTWSYIRKHKIKPVKKTDKIFYFDSEIILEIRKNQDKKHEKANERKESDAVSSTVLAVLEKQLETKREIIKAQQKQVEKQQETIDYFKNENVALRIEKAKKEKLLEDNEKKKNAISVNNEEIVKKQNFWSKLFKRK